MDIEKIYENPTYLRSVLFLRTVLIVIMLSICCSCTKTTDNADKNTVSDVDSKIGSDVDNKANSELKARGKNLRIDAENTFLEMSKAERNEGYDLKGLCSKYIPVGISYADLEVIARAAGMHSKLQATKFYSADIDETKGDFAIEIVLNEALPRTAFYIVVRPDSLNATNKKVGAITACNVTSIYP